MVDPTTLVLTDIAVLLLLGLGVSLLASRFKLPNILLLLLAGVIISQVGTAEGRFEFSTIFLSAIAIVTLVMVVFDGSSRFDFHLVDMFSLQALKVTGLFLLGNSILLTTATILLFFGSFTFENLLMGLLFAFLMTGTDVSSMFVMLKEKGNKVIEFLEIEGIINDPITFVLPFIITGILATMEAGSVAQAVAGQAVPFLKQVIVGIGAGAIVGIIVLKSMKKFYSKDFSPVAIVTAALLTYILAVNLEGNGVLAVATLGLFFGNSYVKEKESLQDFNSMLNNLLVILVFLLIGLTVDFAITGDFLLKTLILFVIMVFARVLAIWGGVGEEFTPREKLFMALCMPKGVTVAVVGFSFAVIYATPGVESPMNTVLELTLAMMIYSIIVTTVVDRFHEQFIGKKGTKRAEKDEGEEKAKKDVKRPSAADA